MWGSTFLAIRVGVRALPPMTFSAVRFLIAGALLSMQMLVGGAILAVIGAVRGEYGAIHLGNATSQTWFAFTWLVFGGSMLALSAYGYALAHPPLSTVATYVYVNRIIAAILGATILSEHIAGRETIGSLLLVVSVAITIRGPARRTDPEPVAVDPTEGAAEPC
jgi:drug/metabolite transporter (DMT)-like permease